MTRINLLPWREARRQKQKRDFIGLLGGAAVVAFLGVILAHMQIAEHLDHQEARNQYLRDEITQLKKIEQEIKELDKTKARLLSRLEVIQNLQRSRPGMVRVFDALTRQLPETIYLSSIKNTGDELTLKGTALSNKVVSDFMRKLQESPWFGEPALKVIENEEINNVRASKFELLVKQTTQPKNTESDGEPQ